MNNNRAVLIGSAQYTHHKEIKKRLDPLELMIKTANILFNRSEREKIKEVLDAIYMVNINSWSYKDAPGDLCEILDIKPKTRTYLSDGGNTPQMLINRASKSINSGTHRAILIIGAEAAYSVYQAKKGRIKLNWPRKEEPEYMEGEIWHGINKFENKYKMINPPYSYAIFETAVRKASGLNLREHKQEMGKLFEEFSLVASKNPYAWTRDFYSSEDIITPSENNRLICHPYTKRMCSNMFVDQAAAVYMTSEKIANNLNIDRKDWVYLMGNADYENIFEISRRPTLHTSPAAKQGAKSALQQAGLKIEDINKFDIYSCFPSIVEIIMKELGLHKRSEIKKTITGGLPYFGGPWSNYSLHAIAMAIDLIQKENHIKIMVIANGGYNTKQSFGIYGNDPPHELENISAGEQIQEDILNEALKSPAKKFNGIFQIDGYTIIYNREGDPIEAIFVGMLHNGRRTFAYFKDNKEVLEKIHEKELVGLKFQVEYYEKLGYNVLKIDENTHNHS